MKLSVKIVLSIFITSFLVLLITIGYLSKSNADRLKKAEIETIKIRSTTTTAHATLYLSKFLNKCESLSAAFLSYEEIPAENRREIFIAQMRKIIENDKDIKAIWSIWEPNALDGRDSLFMNTAAASKEGIFTPSFYRVNNQIKTETTEENQYNEDFYSIPKTTQKPTILEPYYYTYTGNEKDKILETTISVPIIKNDVFLGVIGIDVSVEQIQNLCSKLKLTKYSKTFVVSKNGKIIIHPQKNLTLSSINKYFDKTDTVWLANSLKEDSTFYFEEIKDKGKFNYTFVPIKIGESIPWMLVTEVPSADVEEAANNDLWITIGLSLISLIILVLVGYKISGYVVLPLKRVIRILNNLSQGDIDSCEIMTVQSSDEIGQIRNSVNSLLETLKKTTEFARAIGEHNLNQEFTLLSENDILGNSLIQMQKSLLKAEHDENIRKEQDFRYNWATQGLAKFAEILRQTSDDIGEFGYNVISNLVKYLNCNQGGIFIIDDENKEDIRIKMISSYAYNRRKFLDVEIEAGVGLVGRCYLEAETIYITDVPENYLQISSGLGQENPRYLLIVPIKSNETVVGVVELAAFEQIEKYKIEFVEKVGESIAAAIISVNINLQTNKLLEESKLQREKLSMQEEEMRQHIEELQATQEEHLKNQRTTEDTLQMMRQLVDLFPYPAYIKDRHRCYVTVNNAMCRFFNMAADEFIGQTNLDLLPDRTMAQTIDDMEQSVLEKKEMTRHRQKLQAPTGKVIQLDSFKACYDSQLTGFSYVLGVLIDISDKINIETSHKQQIQVLLSAHDQASLDEVEIRQQLAQIKSEIEKIKLVDKANEQK